MTLDRRRLIAGAAALTAVPLAAASLAACDEATMKKIQARLNPTGPTGDPAAPSGPAAPGAPAAAPGACACPLGPGPMTPSARP